MANDPWVGGAQNHNPEEGEGDWWARKRAAVKAYHEWMPTRVDPPPLCAEGPAGEPADCAQTHEGEAIYRDFYFGDLANLAMLETRLLARAEQAVVGPTLCLF